MPFRMPPPTTTNQPISPSSLNPNLSRSPTSSLSAPTTFATLRLPGPPLPPKPLHLTISKNSTLSSSSDPRRSRGGEEEPIGIGSGQGKRSGKGSRGNRRGELPRWSRIGVDDRVGKGEEEDEGGRGEGTIKLDSGERFEESRNGTVRGTRAGVDSSFETDRAEEDEPQREEEPTMQELLAGSTSQIRYRRRYVEKGSNNDSFKSAVGTLKAQASEGGSTIKRKSIYFDPTNENPFLPPTPVSTDTHETVTDGKSDRDELEEDQEAELPGNIKQDERRHDRSDESSPSKTAGPLQASLVDDTLQLELPLTSLPAVSLHPFSGETGFGELSFSQGIELCIEVEDLGGGWSLGYLKEKGEEGRGLIPRGWYAYVDVAPRLMPQEKEDLTLKANPEGDPVTVTATTRNSSTPTRDLPTPEPTDSNSTLERDLLPEPSTSSPSEAEAEVEAGALTPGARESPLRPPSPSIPTLSSTEEAQQPPGTPTLRSPESYATRSIGRHMVISGAKFEPVRIQEEPGDEAIAEREEAIVEGEEELREPDSLVPSGRESVMRPGLERSEASEGEGESIELEPEMADSVDQSPAPSRRRSPTPGLLETTLDSTSPPRVDAVDSVPPTSLQVLSPLNLDSSSPTEPEPKKTSQGSLLYRLGLTSSPQSNSAPRSYLLGGLSIPGASILAQSHPRRPESPPAEPKRERLSRDPGPMGSRAYVLEWIRKGDELDEEIGEDTQVWDIDSGPVWRSVSEPFVVQVHSPRKLSPLGETPFTSFLLTTHFPLPTSRRMTDTSEDGPLILTVSRRFSHFVSLHQLLSSRFSLLSIPPLPPKAYGTARFSELFVEERRSDLERWIEKIGRHPVLRESEEVRGFLSIQEDKDLRSLLSTSTTSPPSPLFFARVFHPEFNIDLNDAIEIGDRFERHARAIELGGGIKEIESADIMGVREGLRGSANSLAALSISLVRLISGLALPAPSYDTPLDGEEAEEGGNEVEGVKAARRAREWRMQNEQKAMSWKEEDSDALALSKAVQATAEALAEIASSIDTTARYELVPSQVGLQELAQPATQHAQLISTHNEALVEYRWLSRLSSLERSDQLDQLARCETILNITCAEMNFIRSERLESLKGAVASLLDAQIEEKEKSLEQLRFARDHFDENSFPALALTGPRLRSSLERSLSFPIYPPLPTPRSFMSPQTTSAAVRGVIGSTLLRRTSTQRSTSNTLVRTQAGILDEGEEEAEGTGESSERGGTWRESVFGTVKIW